MAVDQDALKQEMDDIRARRRKQLIRRLTRNTSMMIGVIIILLIAVTAIVGPMVIAVSPGAIDAMRIFESPGSEVWFGTDQYGRDLFSRVMWGGRISLAVGLSVMAITTTAGTVIGLLAGYFPRLDNVLMRVMDMFMAFPAFFLAIGIMAILGPRLSNVIIALSIVYTPVAARVVRGMVLQLRGYEFVEAARAIGARDGRIMIRHIFPGCIAPLVVQQTVIFTYAVLTEASLSFIGAGVQPDEVSWGIILSEGRNYLQTAPWVTLFPGIAITITVLSVNLLGDGLRDVLDPRMSK
jgi:peptide/nickel transport system permease protein